MKVRARQPTMRLLTYAHRLSTSLSTSLPEKVPLEKVPLPRLSNEDGRYRMLAAPTHFESQFFKILQRTFTLGI